MAYPLLPSSLRRWHESAVMVLYAGSAAEDMYAAAREAGDLASHRGSRRSTSADTTLVDPADYGISRDLAAHAVALPQRERQMIEAARDTQQTDFDKSFDILWALHGDKLLAERHGRFLSTETKRLIASATAARLVHALAKELMIYRTLPARQWKQVLRDAR